MSRPWSRADQVRLDGWLALAERGWRLFPVRPGTKVPAISQWPQRATSDPDRLSRFFRAHPEHNAGIACGSSGLLVVDCDVTKDDHTAPRWNHGSAVFEDLAALHGGAPETWTVATPSGGRHLYFAAPADPVLGNTSRVLGPLLDTRGDGGQVVAPGSVLPAGGYELLDDTDPAPLPGWLTTALAPPRATGAVPALGDTAVRPLTPRQVAYLESAVAAETERVRRAGRGGHNTAIFTAANALGQLVGAGALNRAEVEAAITTAAEHICAGPCDCTPREVGASIRSGLDRGARNPRRLPDTTTHAPSHAAGGDTVNTADNYADDGRPVDAHRPRPLSHPPPQVVDGEPSDRAQAARSPIEDGDATGAFQTDAADLLPSDADSPIPYALTETGPAQRSPFETADVYTDDDLAAIADATARGDDEEADRLRGVPSGPPVSFALRSVAAAREGDLPAVVARWAPAGIDEEVFTPRAAAERLTERGLTDDEAAAAVVAYLDDVARNTGTRIDRWGMDAHDVEAIARDEQPGHTAALIAVPAPRSAPDADESRRRAQLARWHVDDEAPAQQSAGEGIDR